MHISGHEGDIFMFMFIFCSNCKAIQICIIYDDEVVKNDFMFLITLSDLIVIGIYCCYLLSLLLLGNVDAEIYFKQDS